MKRLIILLIAIAAIASAEWHFNEKDLYSPDPDFVGYQKIPGSLTVVDSVEYYACGNLLLHPGMCFDREITNVKLTNDGKLEVHFRRQKFSGTYEVWKDIYEAQIKLSMVGCIIHADTIIVKAKTVKAKVIPEQVIPERIEWEE